MDISSLLNDVRPKQSETTDFDIPGDTLRISPKCTATNVNVKVRAEALGDQTPLQSHKHSLRHWQAPTKRTFPKDEQLTPRQHEAEAQGSAHDRCQNITRPKPKRKFSRRTKTGCLTCRRRKKKCDEARPAFIGKNCVKGGFPCDGYDPRSF
ncbi:hypothetical protein CLCR_10923 [Cladophialophora carrionii]|uniref:Zn(2)-C6 fungal-type domain-containing protein n=1 Tax=Cladophialophora carrionii TaxID=86049 RepID=A0A1C1CWB4_9EURO|nr:hypothetical protein CLCR_10923 [Cladophialophora carrionii]